MYIYITYIYPYMYRRDVTSSKSTTEHVLGDFLGNMPQIAANCRSEFNGYSPITLFGFHTVYTEGRRGGFLR